MRARSVVIPLIVANIICFFIQLFVPGFTQLFYLVPNEIFARPWILITSMFLHSNTMMFHIFFNMYVLLIFGPLLEQRIGPKRFLILYFVCGVVASFIYSIARFQSNTPALGASGAIMGILGVLVVLLPNMRVLLFFIIPMSFRTAIILIALVDAFGIFPGVAGIAHLAGMCCGLLYGLTLKKKRKIYHRKFSSKSHLGGDDINEYFRSGRI